MASRLTSPVVAGGKVYVAAVDEHTVHAIDSRNGKPLWRFTAGGRVDSPPTIYRGRVLFGSADGWVYCLRATDGKLAWRFRAAPMDQRTVSFGQVESVWPVHGSVLVRDPSTSSGQAVLYCVAGRSMFLDTGLRLWRLDPRTGAVLSKTVLDDKEAETGKTDGLITADPFEAMEIGVDGGSLVGNYNGPMPFAGLIDEVRVYRRALSAAEVAAAAAGRPKPPAQSTGLVLAYSFDRGKATDLSGNANHGRLEGAAAVKGKSGKALKFTGRGAAASVRGYKVKHNWAMDLPFFARAMVLAGKTLFIAGPADAVDEEQAFRQIGNPSVQAALAEQVAAFAGKNGAVLWAVSAADGTKLAELSLDHMPVFDGLVAANGRLYMTTADGRLICLGPVK